MRIIILVYMPMVGLVHLRLAPIPRYEEGFLCTMSRTRKRRHFLTTINGKSNSFLKIVTDERRYGTFTKRRITSQQYTDYSATTGNVTGTGTNSSGTGVTVEVANRVGHTSNKPYRIKAAGIKGQTFRNAGQYRQSVAVAIYSDATVTYTSSTGKRLRVLTGQSVNSPPDYGPNISSSLLISGTNAIVAQAKLESLLKLKNQKIDLGTALAESHKTIAHLAHTASSLLRFVLAVRKGRFGQAAKALGLSKNAIKSGAAIGDRWLEYRFAWQPLMADIHGAVQELHRGLREEAQLFSVVRNVTRTNDDLSSWPTLPSAFKRMTGWSIMSAKVKLYARVSDSELNKITALGVLNPLQIAWELVPFSFVVDWFLPIGDMLEALDATRGLTFVSGSCTTRCSSGFTLEHRPFYLNGTPDSGFGIQAAATLMDREKLITWPYPLPAYWKSPFSMTHLTDALALVRQVGGRFGR